MKFHTTLTRGEYPQMIVRRTPWPVLALALVLTLTPASPHAQGRGTPPPGQGGLPTLQNQVKVLEQKVADLTAALSALSTAVGAEDAALQAQIDAASAQLAAFRQLLDQFNQGLSTAEGKIMTLESKVVDLEAQLAALGAGLTSYDQLHGLPCTTAAGTAGHVSLIGLLKTPSCTETSANGRFLDLGRVVLDTQTSLMWEKKDHAGGLHDVGNVYSWCQATGDTTGLCSGNATSWIGQVNAEGLAGFTGWRLPTIHELNGIVDRSVPGCFRDTPCIDALFGPTTAAHYWSSTEHETLSSVAYDVFFLAGNAVFNNKSHSFHVRAVRSVNFVP